MTETERSLKEDNVILRHSLANERAKHAAELVYACKMRKELKTMKVVAGSLFVVCALQALHSIFG